MCHRHTLSYPEKERQSYVISLNLGGMVEKVSKVDNLRNRKFMEACHLNCEIKKVRLFSFQSHQGI